MKELLIRFLRYFSPEKLCWPVWRCPPSIALATLGLTILVDGKNYAATEAWSMVDAVGEFIHAPQRVLGSKSSMTESSVSQAARSSATKWAPAARIVCSA
jgi:hypothetical protein